MTPSRLLRLAASRPLSVALTSALALYTVFLAAWAATSRPETVRLIAQGLPFQAAYVLLAVNLVACGLQFLPATLRRVASAPSGRSVSAAPLAVPAQERPRLEAALRRLGFRALGRAPDGSLFGVRNATGPLGSTLFHSGLLVFGLGLLVSARTHAVGEPILAEGQDFSGAREEYLTPPQGEPPELGLRVKRIRASFFGEHLLFTELAADVDVLRGGDTEAATLRLSSPWRALDTWVSITGYGYAPEFVVTAEDGREVASGVARLSAFPPGQRDAFDLPGLPHRVHVQVFPDYRAEPGGAPGSRGYLPGDVRLRVLVMRERVRVASGLFRLGEPIAFDGLTLRFPALRAQGTFRLVQDAGWPVAIAGLLLSVGGLAWRLLNRRVEVWVAEGEGGPLLRVRGDLLPEDAGRWARRLAAALERA